MEITIIAILHLNNKSDQVTEEEFEYKGMEGARNPYLDLENNNNDKTKHPCLVCNSKIAMAKLVKVLKNKT